MEFKTRYITKDDFKAYFGIDLDMELQDDSNLSNKAEAFLCRVENRLTSFINANLARNIDNEYFGLSDYQKEKFKLALLEQAYYVFKNGDISSDSGYDTENGIIANKDDLKDITISRNAIDILIDAGIWCRKIRSRGGMYGYWY